MMRALPRVIVNLYEGLKVRVSATLGEDPEDEVRLV